MIRCLLASRVEIGLPSRDQDGEQDVNIYLAHLLTSFADSSYHERIAGYVATHDTSIFERLQHCTDNRLKYTVYRINADHLLMFISVFQNPTGARPRVLPPALRDSDGLHVGRGKAYYDYASTYGSALFGASSGVPMVLGKLATNFESYVRILAHMRTEYLNFVEQLGDGEIFHLQKSAHEAGLRQLRDEFLDAYAEHRREPSPERRARVLALGERLKRLDPAFDSDLPL